MCGLAPSPSPSPLRIENQEQAEKAIGKRVRFEGLTANAKLGAVVRRPGVMMLYCLNRSGWPQSNQTVTVEGTLERTDEFKAGPGAQGTRGGDWVIRVCTLVQ